MQLNQPRKPFFFISLILAVAGALAIFGVIKMPHAVYALLAGYVVLALSTIVKGM